VRFLALLLYAGVLWRGSSHIDVRRDLSASILPKLAQYRLRLPDIPHRLFQSPEYERATQPGIDSAVALAPSPSREFWLDCEMLICVDCSYHLHPSHISDIQFMCYVSAQHGVQ
jgi:hypothetical protein